MAGRNVENLNEIGADIQTCALLSRSLMDIYADIWTVYGSNSMFFSTVCRWVRKFSADLRLVTSDPKSRRSKSASSPMIVEKLSDANILLSWLQTWLEFHKHLHCAFGVIFRNWRRKSLDGPQICSMRSENACMLGQRANCWNSF